MKKNRHEKIIEIVEKYDVETQDELIEYLRKTGYEVTQATVSRDIRELKLTKVMSEKGSYRYELPKTNESLGSFKFSHALAESITSVDYAMHSVVVKTFPGMAQAVAVGIDNLHLPVILGCVAGDDTIIIIARSAEAADDLNSRIKEIIRGQ
jgi:transcriptional regulator of arginine metabolism